MQRQNQGFTLIEMIITVAIISSLAAILVPIVSSEFETSAEASAQGTCRRIGTALNQFFKDTGFSPDGPLGDDSVEYLVTNGSVAFPANPFADDGGDPGNLADYLTNGDPANVGTLWKGPYLSAVEADPWGNAYMINANGYVEADEYVWVLSAGPNGELDTDPTDTILQGDDLGILVD